jgi:hypothetical protein
VDVDRRREVGPARFVEPVVVREPAAGLGDADEFAAARVVDAEFASAAPRSSTRATPGVFASSARTGSRSLASRT